MRGMQRITMDHRRFEEQESGVESLMKIEDCGRYGIGNRSRNHRARPQENLALICFTSISAPEATSC